MWQVDLVEHFIWKLYLILQPFWKGSYCRHRSAMTSSPVTDSFKWGGISEHFMWQVDLVEHFIWKLYLILWLFWMGSHCRYRSGNSWSAVTGSSAWEVYLNLNTSSENMNSYLMSMCTSSCSLDLTTTRGVYLTAYLYTSSENMNSYLMSMCTSSCSLHLTTTRGVYLTAYLYTSSENMNSYLMSMCTSSCSLHLTTSGGDISDSLSVHFIWKYELVSDVCVHFILFTSSDN